MSRASERFERFGDFPYELRQAIWHAVLDDYLDGFPARLFHVQKVRPGKFKYFCAPEPPPMPPVARVCHESRAAATFYYTSRGYRGYRDLKEMSDADWLRPEKDVLLFHGGNNLVEVHGNDEATTYGLVRNLGINYYLLASPGYLRETLPGILRQFHSLRTIYALVPQCHWLGSEFGTEAECCLELPSNLVDIPDSYDDLKPRSVYPETPFAEAQSWRWGDVRARMAGIIRSMMENGEISRDIKLQGTFIVRPKCPGFFVCQLDAYPHSAYRRRIPITESPSRVIPHWRWKYWHPMYLDDQQLETQAVPVGNRRGESTAEEVQEY
ncbi:hypothetical protein F5Y05DRAFT_409704 [Hypoxylon sp. FL0543]|nr:hypothetical protein F5Y05DRAFT_409704 [Hypoxylon sp. FL0543]